MRREFPRPRRFDTQSASEFRGLALDPQAVSNELQLPMTASCRAGDARVTPRGRRLGGRRTNTYCCLKIASGDDGQLAQSLVAASAKLMRHELFLHRLRETAATMYFYVFWYPNGDTGEVFPTSLLLELVGWESFWASTSMTTGTGAGRRRLIVTPDTNTAGSGRSGR